MIRNSLKMAVAKNDNQINLLIFMSILKLIYFLKKSFNAVQAFFKLIGSYFCLDYFKRLLLIIPL